MAKYQTNLHGDFQAVLSMLHDSVMKGSMSASMEDTSDVTLGGVRCSVRVYERYSWLGKNRVSLNITLLGHENDLFLSAITSGGSQAVFFKMNIWGEESFLDTLVKQVEQYKGAR